MKNYDTIVDVANTKSYWPGSVSLNINDSKIKDYYAIGCRLFQGHYDSNLNKYVKNNSIFFMRKFMVFDFDIDEKHYKPKNTDEKNIIEYGTELDKDKLFNNILENNLNEIYNFLGLPKYEIKNKNNYSKYQIKKYFTNSDGVAKLPKKHGCQIVYELDNPILSQFYEIEKLFKIVSKDITIKFGADEGFTNVLFKNYMNRNLFNIK